MDIPWNVSREVTEGVKIWLLGGGLGLLLAWWWLPRRIGRGLLALLAVVATLNYSRWGPDTPFKKVDPYDLIHYYLNAKYFDELGYYDLYPACLLADAENGGPFFPKQGSVYMAQNEAGHGKLPIEQGIEAGRALRASRFTPERWASFEHDFLHLQREEGGLTNSVWRELIQDHGFNGTPAWTFVARPIASAVPVEYVKALGYIDLGLLFAGIGAVAWAYGADAALWSWAFLMMSYSLRWPTITWAFLRYDYVAALLIGLSAVKRGWYFVGGLMTGWAATLRLFPAMWLFGPGAKGFAGLAGRRVHKQLLVLLAGFVVSTAVMEGLSVLSLGVDTAVTHLENMEDHNKAEKLSSRRIGLALGLAFTGDLLPKNIEPARKDLIERQKPLRFGISAIILAALGWGLRKADDDEAYAFGFIPFFLLTTASYYYYVVRVVLVAMHAGDLRKPRNVVGLAMLLGVELFSNAAEIYLPGHRVFLIGGTAWALTAYAVVMSVWFLMDSRRAGLEPAADRPGP